MSARKAGAIALALVALVNAWVAVRLPHLLPESSLDALSDLERRVAAFPHPERVKLLVLGNSHAITGLRPPLLASAMGLPEGSVFSLALPSGTPREMRLLVATFAPRFKLARMAVCNVDEYFLSGEVEMRLRYLTRFDPSARWEHGARAGSLEGRVSSLAGLMLPLFDFGLPIREAIVKRPALTLERLVRDRGAIAGTDSALLATMAYPWGSPPLMDAWGGGYTEKPGFSKKRGYLLMKGAGNVPRGLRDLDALAVDLERRGLAVSLVGLPYTARLRRTLRRDFPEYPRYERQLAGYLATSGRSWLSPPAWERACFTDLDHISPMGARRMAAWLVRQGVRPGPLTAAAAAKGGSRAVSNPGGGVR